MSAREMITSKSFGFTKNNREVFEFTLKDIDGAYVKIINLGASITKIVVPDKNGTLTDVTLGYDTIQEYEESHTYFGTICGRAANRIANGRFTLNGVEYSLFINDFCNSLHGGKEGFCFKYWESEIRGNELIMKYESADMEEGYPGKMTTVIVFAFRNHELSIDVSFTSDKDTIANVINHSYFNLNGHDNGKVLDHSLMINADRFCEDDEAVMPYRAAIKVENTPFDFRTFHKIGERLFDEDDQLRLGRGYDHNWALNMDGYAATAIGDISGIRMDVYTDLPGVQFYSGNVIGEVKGKGGCTYYNYSGFCLETQQFPNAINVPEYPSIVLKANDVRTCKTVYAFSIVE